MLLKIVWKNIVDKKLNSILAVLLMAFGIGIISLLITVGKQLQDKFAKNISGVDMVVGAKGSPLQLILSGVYQIDSPTGNIALSELDMLRTNPLVKEVIPLSMGDNYQGYRIVGSNEKYLQHFKAELTQGRVFERPMEVVVGATVARNLELKLNDTFASSHGYDKEGHTHEDQRYTVVGILDYTNSVLDNLLVSNLESVWQVHAGHEEHGDHEEPDGHDEHGEEDAGHEPEVTCALVKFRSPMGMMSLPRLINQNTKMQAALPAIEVNRLFELMGIGMDAVKALAAAIMLISGVSVFITLFNALKERKYELALMLSMGGTRIKLFFMLLLEGIFLALSGYVLGILFSRTGLWLASGALKRGYNYSLQQQFLQKEEIYLLVLALCIGIVAAVIPSSGIYKINISKTLANE
ncbi:ABC transporter permease [Leadbetterella sp. DM7]|uniref:ABC transporter permease n=1 Tax=Leadbetterella sp. DM7 TaxID=3235085 RepID=UPI00349E6A22